MSFANRCGGCLHHRQPFLTQRTSFVLHYLYITSGTLLQHNRITVPTYYLHFVFKNRVFERRLGSKKFASHLLATSLISLALQVPIILLIRSSGILSSYHHGHLPPGP